MIHPIIDEIPFLSPLLAFQAFVETDACVLLHSAEERAASGRYSFIAVDPFLTLVSRRGVVRVNDHTVTENPFTLLENYLQQFTFSAQPNVPPFQGGAAGWWSYDVAQHLEVVPLATDDMAFAEMAVGFYDLVIAFDHVRQQAWICSSGFPESDMALRQERAMTRLNWLKDKLQHATQLQPLSSITCAEEIIQSNFSRAGYQQAVQKIVDYILAGDIFEANISQRFQAPLPEGLSAWELYRRLCVINPAPFAAFVKFGDEVLVSASPERFVKLTEKQVETRPIKGTRRRGATAREDQQFADELTASEKDHAENVMIVDLLRNDLSRVCDDHSVNVPQLCGLESYAAVHHLVSVVVGVLRADLQAVDLLRAVFPGGSITGAPKVRAMEIIAEVEPTARGPYCGSIGYIGFQGDVDCSIVIRTFALKNSTVTFQAGGAVVADSDPVAEYEETLVKARALRQALTQGLVT